MRCFSKVSSPFQSHLLLLLYSSDTLWQLPKLQSSQVSISTKDYGVKNNKSENRERTLQHWAEGLLLCLATSEAWKAQVSLTQQSNLLAACEAVPLTPQPQLSRQVERQYYTRCYTFPLGRIHHCQADTPWWKNPVLLTELLRSSTATPNCTLHSDISVCASCTSDF